MKLVELDMLVERLPFIVVSRYFCAFELFRIQAELRARKVARLRELDAQISQIDE